MSQTEIIYLNCYFIKREYICKYRHIFIHHCLHITWRRRWQPTPAILPGESHGQRSLAGYSPWGCQEPGMTEHLSLTHLHIQRYIKSIYVYIHYYLHIQKCNVSIYVYFPGGSDGKECVCNARDPGSIPGSGISPGEGNGYPLQYSCLEKPMDRGAWWAAVCGVAQSRTRLKRLSSSSSRTLLFIHSIVCIY